MSNKNNLIILVFTLILLIPPASAQLTLGGEPNQKSIEIKLDNSGRVLIKHLISSSNTPVTVNLFKGEVSNSASVESSAPPKYSSLKKSLTKTTFASSNEMLFLFELVVPMSCIVKGLFCTINLLSKYYTKIIQSTIFK